VVQVREIHVYQNAHVHHAVVAVDRDRFGRHSAGPPKLRRVDAKGLEPLHGKLGIEPDRTSLTAATGPARRPPREALSRPVVATREPRVEPPPGIRPPAAKREARGRGRAAEVEPPAPEPPARVVRPPRTGRRIAVSGRPPFGRGGEAERRIPPPAPGFGPQRDERLAPRVERAGESGAPRVERAGEPGAARAERAREPGPARVGRPRDPGAPHGRAARAPLPPEAVPERGRSGAELPGRREASIRDHGAIRDHEAIRDHGATPARPELPGEPANRVYREPAGRARGAALRAPREEALQPARDPGPHPSGGRGQRGHPGARGEERE
jgi:hypothetical protein